MALLLRYRVLFITVFIALLSIALVWMMKVSELRLYFISLAPLLAFIVSSRILFLLRKEKNKLLELE